MKKLLITLNIFSLNQLYSSNQDNLDDQLDDMHSYHEKDEELESDEPPQFNVLLLSNL